MNLPQRENQGTEKKLYVGYGESTLVGINPTKEELMTLLGIDNEETIAKFKDPEYTGETTEGDKYFRLAFYVRNTRTEQIDQLSFQVTDKERVSKEGKPEWVNQLGANQWAITEDELWDNFKSFSKVLSWKNVDGSVTEKYNAGAKPEKVDNLGDKVFRKALEGEVAVYSFMINMFNLDIYSQDLNLLLDIPTMLKGNFKSLRKTLMDIRFDVSGNEKTVVCSYGVKLKDDGTPVQTVYNRAFLPGYMFKNVKAYNLDPTKLASLVQVKEAKSRKITPVETFLIDTMDEINGFRKSSYFLPQEIDIYDSSKNFLASGAVVASSTSDDY
jgi:hypothetical protein